MRKLYGLSPNKGDICKNCCNLHGSPGSYYKCLIYGNTRSSASDWVLSWRGCGLYNIKPENDKPVIKMILTDWDDLQCEGQEELNFAENREGQENV